MTARAALMPPGPGMFSITTCWPNFLLSRSARMRAVTSATPPGPKGSTILTGFSGHLACADDGASISVRSAAQAAPASVRAHFDVMEILEITRSEEHTSELQSLAYLVCRLL